MSAPDDRLGRISDSLEGRCREWEAKLEGGVLGLSVRLSGESRIHSHNGRMWFPTASVIKVAIVAEVFLQSEEGRLDVARNVEVGQTHRVGGSGVLADMTGPMSLPLSDLATLAITVSDNTASNLCLDAVGGPEAINTRLTRWGIDSVRVHRPIRFDLGPLDPPYTATATPEGMLALMDRLPADVWTRMGSCQDDSMAARRLDLRPWADLLGGEPGRVRFAHKSGAIEGVRNDIGRIEGRVGNVTFAAMVAGCPDRRWTVDNVACVVLGDIGEWLARFVEGEEGGFHA